MKIFVFNNKKLIELAYIMCIKLWSEFEQRKREKLQNNEINLAFERRLSNQPISYSKTETAKKRERRCNRMIVMKARALR